MTCAIVYSSRTGNTKQPGRGRSAGICLGSRHVCIWGLRMTRALRGGANLRGLLDGQGRLRRGKPAGFLSGAAAERKCSCSGRRALAERAGHTLPAYPAPGWRRVWRPGNRVDRVVHVPGPACPWPCGSGMRKCLPPQSRAKPGANDPELRPGAEHARSAKTCNG